MSNIYDTYKLMKLFFMVNHILEKVNNEAFLLILETILDIYWFNNDQMNKHQNRDFYISLNPFFHSIFFLVNKNPSPNY